MYRVKRREIIPPGVPSGSDLAGIIRNEQPDLPIVLLSGFPQDLLVLASVDAVITKGERPQVLLAVLERLTGTKPEKPTTKISRAIEEARNLREQAKAIRSEARSLRERGDKPGKRFTALDRPR